MAEPQDEAARAALRAEIRRKVQSRMRARVGFMWHAAVFAIVNVALFAINQAYSPSVTWFVWPLAAWGAGLGFHGLALYTGGQSEQLIEEEVERELQKRGLSS